MILKLTGAGALDWQKSYGGRRADIVLDAAQDPDGSIFLLGFTQSFGSGGQDIWALHLDKTANAPSCSEFARPANYSLTPIFAATEKAGLASQPFSIPSAPITLLSADAELVIERPCAGKHQP
jgi:hypothetical protein